jgi:hypothetical protein
MGNLKLGSKAAAIRLIPIFLLELRLDIQAGSKTISTPFIFASMLLAI